MRIEDALFACEKTVRERDPDRYTSALFAPAERRSLLFALYAFNHEIARVAETVREPMLGEIRLQWWREAVESARDGRPRNHNVVKALAGFFARTGIEYELFEMLIDARGSDAPSESFADLAALEAYADATSGGVMRIAARILGAGDTLDEQARALGIAYALTGLMRSIPFHAARRKLFLPRDLLAAERVSEEDIFAGRGGLALNAVIGSLAARAHCHLSAARKGPKPSSAVAAILPAATVRADLKRMTRPGFDAFAARGEAPAWRRQLAMLTAALRGRV